MAGAQSQPKELPWAVAEFAGGGEWASRLPLLLMRGWSSLADHQTSEAEQAALRQDFLTASLKALDIQASQASLDLDKKRLRGALPVTEPEATQKTMVGIEARRALLLRGVASGMEPPKVLTLKPVWGPGRENLPWADSDRDDLLGQSKALYAVTGVLRTIGGYLSVRLELYSSIEDLVLSTWEGQFAPDEATDNMGRASDQFRAVLLGKPWAGLSVASPVSGSLVGVGKVWHVLPWSSDDFEPGDLVLHIKYPGGSVSEKRVTLEPGRRVQVTVEAPGAGDTVLLETEPPGVSLYLDSRYLGPSPQTVDRPLATSRVRAQAPGWATAAWEIGPATVSPSRMVLVPPAPLKSVPDAKDRFYFSLAAFSFSLTSTAFVGAWRDEQVKLTNAYSLAGSNDGYQKAKERFEWAADGYAASVVLTSGVFVWMMFELGNYLGTAQASLP